ncbi:hypothetical protein FKM82_026069, partial [Ascaphus truei]
MSIHEVEVSVEEARDIVEEALDLRRKRQALTVRELEPDLKLVQPLPCFTWKCLGECLLAMYRHLTTCEPPRPSLGKRIDLAEYRDPAQLCPPPPASTPISIAPETPIIPTPPTPVLPAVELPPALPPVTPTVFSHSILEASAPQDMCTGDKTKKGVKRKKLPEDAGETAKRRSARVRNTRCKKEERIDFQELLLKFLPSR